MRVMSRYLLRAFYQIINFLFLTDVQSGTSDIASAYKNLEKIAQLLSVSKVFALNTYYSCQKDFSVQKYFLTYVFYRAIAIVIFV